MGRRAKLMFPLQDGRTVGASLKVRGEMYRVQYPHPRLRGQYVETTTKVPVRMGQGEAWKAAAQIIGKAYAPTLTTDPMKATWEEAMIEVAKDHDLRERSLEAYTSILNVFRATVPESNGPGDVTADMAEDFKKKYTNTPFKRSKKDDAKGYKRSAKTVENSIRRLSTLWVKLKPKYVRENVWEGVTRPTVPRKKPQVPGEDEVQKFFDWLDARYPVWTLPRLFVEVKALSGCRLNDLCQIYSWQLDPVRHTLTIKPEQDKTHRERTVPLPADLSEALNAVKGPTYLWERYLEDSRKYRPSTRTKNRAEFTPSLMYHGMQGIFSEYADQGGKLRSHGLRKRAITLMTLATQNIDQTAQAIGIDAQTARKYYLDAKQAFETDEVFKRMASVLRPPQKSAPTDPEAE